MGKIKIFKANTLGRLAAILSRKPVICLCHVNDGKDRKRWQTMVDKLLCRFTDKIIPDMRVLPMVLLESMALDIPIVATSVDGISRK